MQHSSGWAGPQMAAQSAEGGTDIKVLPCWDDFLTNGVSQTPIPVSDDGFFLRAAAKQERGKSKEPKTKRATRAGEKLTLNRHVTAPLPSGGVVFTLGGSWR